MANRRIVFIGLGGASCSGKTTLARHLLRILPEGSFVVHQDDFAPPDSAIPIHPVHGIADWDDAPGAIDWPRLRRQLYDISETGRLPEDHRTYDYLYAPTSVAVDDDVIQARASKVAASQMMKDTIYVLVDGFIMFWDREINDLFSVRLFIREDKAVLRKRREDRRGFVTAEGTWEDPPGYFEKIVWPAYVKAHASLFENGDVEHGGLSQCAKREGMLLLQASKLGMTGMLEAASEAILSEAESRN